MKAVSNPLVLFSSYPTHLMIDIVASHSGFWRVHLRDGTTVCQQAIERQRPGLGSSDTPYVIALSVVLIEALKHDD